MSFTRYYQKDLKKYRTEAEEAIRRSNGGKKVFVGDWHIAVGYGEDRAKWFFVVPYTVDGETKEYRCTL